MSDNTKKKKQFRLPHMYLVIAILMLFVSLLTYVVPAGSYTRGDNGAVDPDSFTYTDSSPVGILSFFTSIHKGFVDSASIIATVLLVYRLHRNPQCHRNVFRGHTAHDTRGQRQKHCGRNIVLHHIHRHGRYRLP